MDAILKNTLAKNEFVIALILESIVSGDEIVSLSKAC